MGYVNTIARKLPSDAWMAGEVWIQPSSGLITNRLIPSYDLGPIGSLGDGEEIGPIIQALTAAGAATYGIIQSRHDAKQAREDAAEAAREAAAAQAAANPPPSAAPAPGGTPAAGGKSSSNKLLLYGGLGLGALIAVALILRR